MALEDQVFAEVDRQLVEQRAHADALASRAGLLIAAVSVAATLLAGRLQNADFNIGVSVLWTLGLAATLGVLVFLTARLVNGPAPSQLGAMSGNAGTSSQLLAAKIIAVEGNNKALLRAEVVFVLQAIATVVTLAQLLWQSRLGT